MVLPTFFLVVVFWGQSVRMWGRWAIAVKRLESAGRTPYLCVSFVSFSFLCVFVVNVPAPNADVYLAGKSPIRESAPLP